MIKLGGRGDTIVEVLLAMALLSAILFTSWSIVNRSSQINLAARQRVVMVGQLKEQAEIIKAMYTNQRESVIGRTFGGSTPKESVPSINPNPCVDSKNDAGVINGKNPTYGFHFDENAAVSSGYQPKTVQGYENAKVWVQVDSQPNYIDFHIRACWQVGGGNQNDDSSYLIMRLNT